MKEYSVFFHEKAIRNHFLNSTFFKCVDIAQGAAVLLLCLVFFTRLVDEFLKLHFRTAQEVIQNSSSKKSRWRKKLKTQDMYEGWVMVFEFLKRYLIYKVQIFYKTTVLS